VADTVIASTANANMDDAPLWLQKTGADADITYTAILDRTVFDALYLAEGVLGQTSFLVSQRGAGANFSVDVAAGYAVILGDSVANQGKYLIRSVGVVNVTTPAAPGSGTRVHRVIARIRDKVAAGANYDWTLELLEDTGTGTPALPASAISLATVSITVAQASVTNTNITNLRPVARDATYLGTIGGKRYTGGGALALAIAGTEATIQDSGLIVHPPNTIFKVTANVCVSQNTTTGNTNLFRIRENTLGGTQRMEYLWVPDSASQGTEIEFGCEFETGSTPQAITWVVTGVRLTGSNTFDCSAGNANKTVSVRVDAIGPAGVMTIV
jgi:hypothetical protein